MQARTIILMSALTALAAPLANAQQAGADEAALQRESALEVERAQREIEATASEAEAVRAIEAQVESARREMEAARVQMERAAREVVVQSQPVFIDENGVRVWTAPGANWVTFAGPGSRAQIGASLVNADGGALVTQVAEGSGAADAGLKVGDVIQSIDGIDLADGNGEPYTEVITRIAAIEAGATVQLVVERGGQEIDLAVETQAGSPFVWSDLNTNGQVFLRTERAAATAERAVANAERAAARAAEAGARGGAIYAAGTDVDVATTVERALSPLRMFSLSGAPWGEMELVPITPELGRYFQTEAGLLVVRAPSDDAVGLEDGDVILSIGDRTPTSPEHAIRILGSFEPGEVIEFALMRDGRRRPLQYTVEESGFQFFSPNIAIAPATAVPAAPAMPGGRARGPATAPSTPAPAAPVSPTSP